ncbi:hypothetical protein P9B58_09475 [Bacillus mojavensis]|nr:hypothetical protein [Bacillus mojavensis]MEC1635021.1 hypothetical protein [Bacillus mojavensis]MEC1702152.1 hypothetical protein [Bacillus mojavensis]MEC5246631.1 hypothetical protein [Bacillus mojavensis]
MFILVNQLNVQSVKKSDEGYPTLLGRTGDAGFFKNKCNPAFQSLTSAGALNDIACKMATLGIA